MKQDSISQHLGLTPNIALFKELKHLPLPKDSINSNRQDGCFNNNYGKKHSAEVRKKLSEKAKERKIHPMSGKKHSEETRKKISQSCMGRVSPRKGVEPWNKKVPMSQNVKEKISLSKTGVKRTIEEKKAISKGAKNRIRYTCTHCNKNVDASNYSRWHGLKCKESIGGNEG